MSEQFLRQFSEFYKGPKAQGPNDCYLSGGTKDILFHVEPLYVLQSFIFQ